MGDGDEVILEEQEHEVPFELSEYKADMMYDRWREDYAIALGEAIEELFERFVKGNGYYHDAPDRFVEHAIQDLKFAREMWEK